MNSTLIGQILLQIFLIGLNAVFACAEIAVLSVNENKLTQMAENGDKRAVRLRKLTCKPARFLATIQVAITLSGFLGSAFAAENFSDILVKWLISIGVSISEKTLDSISVVVITLILSYFTLVFGELVPKRIAMKKSEELSLKISGLVSFISKLFAPIVWILTVSTNAILKLCKIDPNADEDDVSEEDIRMMVNVGNKKGVIDSDETQMIQNVFEFDNIAVSELGTHRTDISALYIDEDNEKWEKTIYETRHTLYPVCEETVDDIIGVLNIKDYFSTKDKSRENILKNVVKSPYCVPQGIYADDLFRQMKNTHNHFAIILDEYGGVVAIVTMSDILEQIVGDIDDNISEKNKEPELVQIDENMWQVNGKVQLDEVAKEMKVDLPVDDYLTVGGMIFGFYGIIPNDGTQFEIDILSLHIEVKKIKDHKIEKAIISLKN